MNEEELIYDWNQVGEKTSVPTPPRLVDHTLACARLSSSLRLPDQEGQKKILTLLHRLGLEHLCLGSWCDMQVRQLPGHCQDLGLRGWVELPALPPPPAHLGCYFNQKHGPWRKRGEGALTNPQVLVIQDATRKTPAELIPVLKGLAGTGIEAVCLADDGGRATPAGAARLVAFVVDALGRMRLNVEVEWSGRNDRGLALASALAAWKAGAQVLHCSFFGLGEGCGLVPTEQLLVNLSLAGALRRDLKALGEITRGLAEVLDLELHPNLPIIGGDAFRTGTGVHAAAIMKAQKKGHDWLADLIYSGVPANQFGFRQLIEVGPMAGASNVQYWLQQQGIGSTPEVVQAILSEAKRSQKVLAEEELMALVRQCGGGLGGGVPL